MFLIRDDSVAREARIPKPVATDPPLAVILGAVYVEWAVQRAAGAGLLTERGPAGAARSRLWA